MAKQRYNIGVNSLSYAKSEVPYVAQPVKEILGLMQSREDRYVKTKANINMAEELKKSIPYHESSKGVFDGLLGNINNTLSTITPDNYADSELDSAQITHDAINKWGGKELDAQYKQVAANVAEIDKAEDIRPEIKEWKKKDYLSTVKSIEAQPNGTFSKGNGTLPKLVKDPKVYDGLVKLMGNWKSSGLYQRDPKTGVLTINNDLVGQYGITKTTFNDEAELFKTAMSFMMNEPNVAEWFDDESEFELSKRNLTPESALESANPAVLKSLFPSKDPTTVTVEDILSFSKGNPEIFKELAKTGIALDKKSKIATDISNVFGYKDDSMSFFEDKEYNERIKKKYSGVDEEEIGPLAYIKTAPTTIVGNPTIYEEYEKHEEELTKAFVDSKENFDFLEKELAAETDENRKAELQMLSNKAKEELQQADKAIEDNIKAKENITKSTLQLAKTKGIDVEKYYDSAVAEEGAKATKSHNASKIVEGGYNLDITSQITKTNVIKPGDKKNTLGYDGEAVYTNKTVNVSIPGFEHIDIPVYQKEQYERNKNTINSPVIVEANGKSVLITPNKIANMTTVNFTGAVADKLGYSVFKDRSGKKTKALGELKETPNLDDFNLAVSKLVMNPDSNITNLPTKVLAKAKEVASKVSAVVKPGDVKVNQTLDYLFVDEQVKKGTAAYELHRLNLSAGATIEADGGQYSVIAKDTGQQENLVSYLKRMGIEYTSEFINFEKTSKEIRVLTTADRKYGPRFNMPFSLTQKGIDAIKKVDENFFDMGGTVNLTGVNTTGRDSGFSVRLKDANFNAFKESYATNGAGGEENRKVFGLIEFQNNAAVAEKFNALNLYTVADGDKVEYDTPDGYTMVINAVKRRGNPNKLGDNDFYLSNKNGDVFVQPTQLGGGGGPKYVPFNEYKTDTTNKKYKLKMYASPEDIQADIGKTMLMDRALKSNSTTMRNEQVKTTGNSYTIQPDSVKSDAYASAVRAVRKENVGKVAPRNLSSMGGTEQSYNMLIDSRNLADLRKYVPDSIKKGVLPYVNKAIVNQVTKLANDYGIYITDAVRSVDGNKSRKESANDSLHMYGHSIDARYDEKGKQLLASLEANPQLAQDLGIAYAFKHTVGSVSHVHIEFA